MRRRALLSVCAASLASLSGCAILGEGAETSTDTSTQTPAESSEESPTQSPTESPESSCLQAGTVSLEADDEFVATEKYDNFVFDLRNQTECSVAFNPVEDWEISAKSPDGWEPVASEGGVGTDEQRILRAGDQHRWNLSLYEHPTPAGETTTYIFVDLPEGTYRFTVTATVDGSEEITRETTFDVVRRIPTASDSGNTSH